MLDKVVTVRLSRDQAAFLQTSLCLMATTTRQAMARPGLQPERHMALGSRAIVLERTEDAIRSAMLEPPENSRKSARGAETIAGPFAARREHAFRGRRQA